MKNIYWFILIIAGILEVMFTFCLGKIKETPDTETPVLWYSIFGICLIASMVLLLKALKQIPIGTAYAVWTGIGAVGTVLMGIVFFNEPADFWRLFFISTLIVSILGLKFVSGKSESEKKQSESQQ